MIEKFDFIKNVGRFERVQVTSELKHLTVVYSENARGKTTLCAILRSLTESEPKYIEERKRLSATDEVGVVAQVGGNSYVYANSAWNQAISPKVLVFDERFVAENVFSGMDVEPGHRKNLHELILGEAGIRFQKDVQDLTAKIATLQTEVRQKGQELTPEMRGQLSVDEFCTLQKVQGLDDAIAEASRMVSVVEDASKVLSHQLFEPIGLPVLTKSEVEDHLGTSLPDLEAEAEKAVSAHAKTLGKGAEEWLSDGVEFAEERSTCPFCDQDLTGSSLFAHYQGYFSKAYAEHIQTLSDYRNDFVSRLGGDAIAALQRKLQALEAQADFWKQYVEVPEERIDQEQLLKNWKAARDSVLQHLDEKAANPLAAIPIEDSTAEALDNYAATVKEVESISESYLVWNTELKQTKEQAKHASLATAKAQLARLKASQKRFEPTVEKLCQEYLQAKKDKQAFEQEKEAAKKKLTEHRQNTFPKHELAINKYLLRFNANFTVEGLQATDPRGEPSSNYGLKVNKHMVSLNTNSTAPEPSFSTTLSTGDKNTLALAFFFASLEEHSNLRDVIVVIDDPASSLDDGRTIATAQEIRSLCGKAKQVIVLSHSKGILCEIWEHADKTQATSLEIVDAAQDTSTIEDWDVHAAAITEYDRRHRDIRAYVEHNQGQAVDIAPSLRVVLEGFLRTVCVEHFPPGKMLGPFINESQQAAANGDQRLSESDLEELDKLKEYANRFHHDNAGWQQELAQINHTELKGFAKRVLDFTRVLR